MASIRINAQDLSVTTSGNGSDGIRAYHQGSGNIDIFVSGGSVTTQGSQARGIMGWGLPNIAGDPGGDIIIRTRNHSIVTENAITGPSYAYGIYALRQQGSGKIDLDLQSGSVTTKGLYSYGVYGWINDANNSDDLIIKTRDYDILTESTDLYQTYQDTFSVGLHTHHGGLGNIDIDLRGGSIETRGVYSYGVFGVLRNAAHGGELLIRTGDGNTVTTTGDSGHGIVAYNYGTMATSRTAINIGGTVTATGAGAQAVRVGVVGNDGAPSRVAALGPDGYRKQTVTVNGSVMGNAAGVFLAGGGLVVIGPRGRIDSESGIAILAMGTVPAPDPNPDNVEAIPPRLRVDLNLGGRRVAEALGDNWILNDGGETTIAVNGTVLHDSAGVTGHRASNGAWNVRMRADGVTVMDRTTDPWTFSAKSTSTIADRDFSAEDFNERRKPPPPPPPPPPPEPSVHMVDERVFGVGEAAGLLLEAGGEVYIGPMGTVGAESGIAILATGDAPKLLVDMNLNGRRVAEVIGDDWILNDGGKTTLVVNA